MKPWHLRVATAWMAFLAAVCEASDVRGTLGADSVWFPSAPMFVDRPGADQDGASWHFSGSATLDWSGDLGAEEAFAVNLFARAASNVEDAYFADIREAVVVFDRDTVDVKVGVLSETWGVLEAWNPVDIVNQRDMVEDFQGEAKLGQPGLSATLHQDDLVLSFLALTYARERRIAEGKDRLRTLPERVRSEDFEDGRYAPSLAARAQYRIGDLDLALSHFHGHDRDPLYAPLIAASGALSGFHADYLRVSQTALEAQYVLGDSVLKGEFIYQTGGVDSFLGGGVGFETVFNRFAGEGDLSLYAEFYRDARANAAPLTPFQDDLFIGARYSCNDTSDTQFEARFTYDIEWDSTLVDLRAQRRLQTNFILDAQIVVPSQVKTDPALQGFRNDKYLELGLTWYY